MDRITLASWGRILAAVFVVSLLLAGQSFAYTAGDPEHRGFWVDAWHAGALNQSQVDAMLGSVGTTSKGYIRSANCNTVVLEVRREADVMYPSAMGEPYMSGLSPSTFNGLQAVINAAHDTTGGKKRIDVIACIVAFKTGGGAVYGAHDDTPTGSLTTLDNYWPTRDNTGAETADYAFDPGHPLAEDYTVNVAMDLVNHFDIDGIQYDYIRYTGNNQGYNPTNLARYNARYGLTGQPSSTDSQWQQWRRDQVTAVVRKIYAKIQAVKPWVKQSGSVVTMTPAPNSSDRAGFMATRPYYEYYTDWDSWLQEGILDAAYPMTYYDYSSNSSDYIKWINFEKDRHGNRHMYIGPGGYLDSLSDSITEILLTRTASPAGHYAQGWNCFSYYAPFTNGGTNYGTWANFSPSLISSVTSTWADIPAMTWKTTPTKGHISGNVTYNVNGKWADGATVSITGPESRSMYCDGTGFYAFIDLTPGVYTVKASKLGYPDVTKTVTVAVGSVTGNMYTADFGLGDADVVISSVQSSLIQGGATVTWSTNVPATSRVQYGLTTSYGSYTTFDGTLIMSHSQDVTGLLPWTTYHYRACSGTMTVPTKYSSDYTFTTDGPPTISNIQVSSVGSNTATITWNTDAASTSKVNYGTTASYGLSVYKSTVVNAHTVTLTNLAAETTYHFQVQSANTHWTASSTDSTFTTTSYSVQVDNSDSGWVNTSPGSNGWSAATNPSVPKIGSTYIYCSGDGSTTESSSTRRCTWTPVLAYDGYYDVYAYYSTGSTRNTAAPFTIHYSGGQSTSIQNEYASSTGGGWFLIGPDKPFVAGSSGYVELTTLSTDTKYVSGDAIKWVYKAPLDTTPPSVAIGTPSVSSTKSGPVSFTVTYGGADSVTLSVADVTLNKTGSANGTMSVSGSGLTTRTVTISGITGTGTLGISIGNATASDSAGNQALAAGPSTTFTADNTAPVIGTVTISPTLVAAQDPIHVVVGVTDDMGVGSVIANTVSLVHTTGDTWAGDVPADANLGYNSVEVSATDTVGNVATDGVQFYRTAQVVGTNCRGLTEAAAVRGRNEFLFKLFGKVTSGDADHFTIVDGSGAPITVYAPGYITKVVTGNQATVRGILNASGGIDSDLSLIKKF